MIYIESPSTDPRWNLALEEFVFSYMDPSNEYFMLWQNHNTIVVGKNQNTIAEIDTDYVHANNITVVRRLSGGGTVYHDLGNLNFSFIADAENMSQINFTRFCQPVVKTLQQMGVPAETNGRNDMVIVGKKFSGNAQYTRHGRVLHHGTLMFSSRLDTVSQSLRPNRKKLQSKGIASVSSRVCNICDFLPETVTLEHFKEQLLRNIIGTDKPEAYVFSEAELSMIEKLKRDRYDRWEWNYGFSPRYQITKEDRIEGCGTLQLSLDIDKGIIRDIQFFGDFFDYGNMDALSELLRGCSIQKEALEAALNDHDPSQFIRGLNASALVALITEG